MQRWAIAVVAAGAIGSLASSIASAHFILESPANWAEQDIIGDPQKSGPCGQADPEKMAVPTNAVTAFESGQTITVSIEEAVFHAGHYRVVLSTTGRDGLPPDPETTDPSTCSSLEIQDPPVFPVLADGRLQHTEPLEGIQSFDVTLPSDVTCTNCTLQVLEFMQSEFGSSDNCFYHHCADITISAPTASTNAGSDAEDEGAGDAGCALAMGERSAPASGVVGLLALVALLALRTRRIPSLSALGAAGFLGTALMGLMAAGCGEDPAPTGAFLVSPGDVEKHWLVEIGTGAPQTATACGRGATDPIARELCRSPRPELEGLGALYDRLGISPGSDAAFAVATHSLGLSARVVSELNPRTVVFSRTPLEEDKLVAVASSRGTPFVELVGYDPQARDFNFYLLMPRLACEGEEGEHATCTPSDLLTERIESGWLDWTLYADRDLEDTPLDCSSCHRPGGAGTPARLLMRQVSGPWMHWGEFRGVTPPTPCLDDDGSIVSVEGEIVADGADLLVQLDGPDGRRGAVPVADLIAAASGYDMSSFLFYAAGLIDGTGDVPCEPPDCPYSEPHPFSSHDVLCDRLMYGRADAPGRTWETYRNAVLAQGLPVPYFEPNVVDEPLRSNVASDFDAFLDPFLDTFVDAAAPGSEQDDAFTRLSGLMGAATARAIGFLPERSDSVAEILTKMCVRCHNDGLDAGLGRSGFNATALDSLEATTAQNVLGRISLPRTSPLRMPPLLAGELPDWAIAGITEFLEARGTP